jgi:hypothetical protein
MQTPAWVTSGGEEILLAKMSSEHIRAAMRYLQTGTGEFGPMNRPGCAGFTNTEWLQLMAAELMRRTRAGCD